MVDIQSSLPHLIEFVDRRGITDSELASLVLRYTLQHAEDINQAGRLAQLTFLLEAFDDYELVLANLDTYGHEPEEDYLQVYDL